MSQQTLFIFWWLLLAGLLFYPVSKLVWVLSVRRLQRKLGRELNPAELQGQRKRARVIAVVLTLGFSFIYNIQTIGLPQGG